MDTNPTHPSEIARDLEYDWPGWKIWFVPRAVGPTTWHARRWDDENVRLEAVTPSALVEQLEAWVAP